MRKSLNTSLSDSLSSARVFGIPLEEVQHSGQPGHEVPLLVRSIVEYIEEHGESGGKPGDSWYFLSSLYSFLAVITDGSIIVTEMTSKWRPEKNVPIYHRMYQFLYRKCKCIIWIMVLWGFQSIQANENVTYTHAYIYQNIYDLYIYIYIYIYKSKHCHQRM